MLCVQQEREREDEKKVKAVLIRTCRLFSATLGFLSSDENGCLDVVPALALPVGSSPLVVVAESVALVSESLPKSRGPPNVDANFPSS